MSQVFNDANDTFRDDSVQNSNVTGQGTPRTGQLSGTTGFDLVGGPIEGQPDCFHRGPDFMKAMIQPGAVIPNDGYQYVCESVDGTAYTAFWRKVTD